MGFKHYIAAGIIAVFAQNVSGEEPAETCSGASVSGACFDLEHSAIDKTYDAGSERIYAVVYEKHTEVPVQVNAFYTIEELIEENDSRFLAMEYFEGEFSFESDLCRFDSNPGLYSSTLNIFAGIGCSEGSTQQQRRNNALYYVRADAAPVGVASMLEIIYSTELVTFGMDDWELRNRAHTVGMAMTSEADILVYEDIINRQRSIAFVRNIQAFLNANSVESRVVIVSTGLNHKESLEAELQSKGISYISIMPFGIDGHNIEEE